jgi:hypothetical protein
VTATAHDVADRIPPTLRRHVRVIWIAGRRVYASGQPARLLRLDEVPGLRLDNYDRRRCEALRAAGNGRRYHAALTVEDP